MVRTWVYYKAYCITGRLPVWNRSVHVLLKSAAGTGSAVPPAPTRRDLLSPVSRCLTWGGFQPCTRALQQSVLSKRVRACSLQAGTLSSRAGWLLAGSSRRVRVLSCPLRMLSSRVRTLLQACARALQPSAHALQPRLRSPAGRARSSRLVSCTGASGSAPPGTDGSFHGIC